MTVHKHHKIPRHAGGTNDPSNIELLTIEEHAEAHRLLWEKNGMIQDWLAWKALSGSIGKEEIMRIGRSLGGKTQGPRNKGWTPSAKTRELWSKQRKGKPSGSKGKTWKDSPETKQRKSLAAKGKPKKKNFGQTIAKLKSKTYVVITPNKDELIVTNLKSFCVEHNLQHSLMYKVANGYRKQHKGYHCFHM